MESDATEHGHCLYVRRMRKHIDRLNFFNRIFFSKNVYVPRLCGRITAYIYDNRRFNLQ